MDPSGYTDRVVDVAEQLFKVSLLLRGRSDFLTDRCEHLWCLCVRSIQSMAFRCLGHRPSGNPTKVNDSAVSLGGHGASGCPVCMVFLRTRTTGSAQPGSTALAGILTLGVLVLSLHSRTTFESLSALRRYSENGRRNKRRGGCSLRQRKRRRRRKPSSLCLKLTAQATARL